MDSLTRVLNSSTATRRLVAVGLLVAVVLVLIAALSAVTASVFAGAESVREKRAHLGRLQTFLELKPTLLASEAPSDGADDRPEFLSGTSDAVIQADLQSRLDTIAETYNVEIMSVGNAPLVEEGGVRFAGLRANISGSNEGIHEVVAAIESTKPYLIIRQAELHSTLGSQEAAFSGPAELVLQVQFYGALPPSHAPVEETIGGAP